MPRFSIWNNELMHSSQQVVQQPASRRTVGFVGAGGFTIVELLIVIVVIGILAAIVIVAYNGITSRAKDTSVNADLSQVGKKLELFKAKNGTYPVSVADLTAADIVINKSLYTIGRNNLYYRANNEHYILGSLLLSASTGHRCLVDGSITAGSCNSHTNVGTMFTDLGFGTPTYSTSWHSDTTGWQVFVGG